MGRKEKDKINRIAFYIGGLSKGGAERVICNLAEFFFNEGYEVFMVTKEKNTDEYILRPEIRRIIADITPEEETGSRLGNLKARINKLTSIWKEIEPDIIVSFIRKNNLMAIASARPLEIPVIVSVRSAPARELAGKGMKQISFFMFRLAEGVVLQTNEAKEFFPGYIQKKAIVLPNSINASFIEEKGKLDATMDSCLDRKKEIITVGRIDNNKNQKMLIEAFMEIADDYADWHLKLYGDGEERENLAEMVRVKGFEEKISFKGAISNVPSVMREASIFVLPSKVEGMPNALIEAMVMGMACISTDCPCGGPRDLIIPLGDDNQRVDNVKKPNGILIPVDDKAALVKELRKLIESEEVRKELGKEASKLADILHPDKVNARWKEYIEKVYEMSR